MIYKTDKVGKGRGSHYHIAYAREGMGETSTDNKHSHQIIDGEVLEAEGHTHILEEMAPNPGKKERADKVEAMVMGLFREARDNEKKSRESGRESEDFYLGKQWKSDMKAKLEADKRAALTINEIAPKVDVLSGYQRQNRTDYKFFPVEGGDAMVADLLGEVVKNICEQNDFPYVETAVFEDETICGRGFFDTYIDYDEDIDGKIVIDSYNWDDVYLGPHTKLDLSDLEYLHKAKWFSWAKVKQMYPDSVKKIRQKYGHLEVELEEHKDPMKGYADDNYNHPDKEVGSKPTIDPELADIARKEYRVVETQIKEHERVTVLFNMEDDFYTNTTGWSDKDVASAKTIPSLRAVPRKVSRMRFITTVGGVMVDDDYPDLAVQDFHLVPAYGKKRGDKWFGIVEAAKDPQREINKQHSQLMDITNKMISYGWLYQEDTFASPKEAQNFKSTASQAGFFAKVTSVERPPLRVEGPKFPNELANAIVLNKDNIRQIMNVNLELSGQTNRAESGIAIDKKQRQALLGNEYLFDNHSRAKKKLGKLLVAQIQKVYTPERILRIVENRNERESVKVAGQPLDKILKPQTNDPRELEAIQARRQAILKLLETEDLTKYDVVVAESAYSPTKRYATFLEWKELAQANIGVPIDFLVDLSDLPDKQKVIESIKAQQAQQAQMEQMKINAEVQKAQIAASSKQGGANEGGMG